MTQHKQFTQIRGSLRITLAAISLAGTALSAHAVENETLLQFSGQTVAAAGVAASHSIPAGGLVVAAGHTGYVLPSDHSYIFSGAAFPNNSLFTLAPSTITVPSRIGVFDQRASSSTRITATCLNPSTLAMEPCDLSNTALFPRTFVPVSAAPYTAVSDVVWDNALKQLTIRTPGAANQNIQSNGLFIKMSPYVRSVNFRSSNTFNADFIAIQMQVGDAPSVSKAFAPAAVKTSERSTLTISLKNPDLGAPVPNVNLTDVLPAPLKLVSATHTCTSGTFSATAGSSTISLTGATLPTAGCQITAEVEWPNTVAGNDACSATPTLTNTITPPAQFSTALGQLATPATATLACSGVTLPPVDPPKATTPVPGLGASGLLLTSAGIGALAAFLNRRRKKHLA